MFAVLLEFGQYEIKRIVRSQYASGSILYKLMELLDLIESPIAQEFKSPSIS